MRCVEKSILETLSVPTNDKPYAKNHSAKTVFRASHSNAHESEHTVTGYVQFPEQLSVTAVLPTPLVKLLLPEATINGTLNAVCHRRHAVDCASLLTEPMQVMRFCI
jgi:hypothetical protein